MNQTSDKKLVSCGVIITDGSLFLVCHVPTTSRWDLPKGTQNEGESNKMTALRELYEETGIVLYDENQLDALPEIPYLGYKDLRLFLHYTTNLPKAEAMKCESIITLQNNQEVNEVDEWKYISFEETSRYLFPNMNRVIVSLMPKIKELLLVKKNNKNSGK